MRTEGQASLPECQEWLYLADGLIKMHNEGKKKRKRQRQTGRKRKLAEERAKELKKEVN